MINKKNTSQNNSALGNNRILSETKIKGDITSNSDVRIDGEVEGGIETTGKIVIGKSGFIKGTIICENADIEGTIEGNIKVSNILNLKSTAKVSGDVQVNKLSIEPGAEFNVNCSMKEGKQLLSEKKIRKKSAPINKWIQFSNIGLQMAATIVICVLLGRWLDEKYPNLYPLFTVVLSLLGVFSSLYLVYKQVITMSKEEDKE